MWLMATNCRGDTRRNPAVLRHDGRTVKRLQALPHGRGELGQLPGNRLVKIKHARQVIAGRDKTEALTDWTEPEHGSKVRGREPGQLRLGIAEEAA
jgi:hypothetical protein